MPYSEFKAPDPRGWYGVPTIGLMKMACDAVRTTGVTDPATIGLIQKSFQIQSDGGGLIMVRFLLLDCPNLLYRAYHTTGKKLDGGTTFGFLKYLSWLENEFVTRHVAFCFDSLKLLRKEVCPTYKEARHKRLKEMDGESLRLWSEFKLECSNLCTILEDLGYENIFMETGYEADDLIASLVQRSLSDEDEVVIVSSDKDLFQLLGPKVSIWHPSTRGMYSPGRLASNYSGISPKQWSLVKAIAGCSSDGIPGVRGVGDTTAAKYLTGALPATSKKAQLIASSGDTWKKNLKLVELPYKGCPALPLSGKTPTINQWNAVVKDMEIRSLVRLR